MRRTTRISGVPVAILVAVALLLYARRKSSDLQHDHDWNAAIAVSSSASGLSGWARLFECGDKIIGARSSAAFLMLNIKSNSWSELPQFGDPDDYVWAYSTIDPQTKRVLVPQGYSENEQLILEVFMGTITESGLKSLAEATHITVREALIGEAGSNVKMNETGKRQALGLGPGVLNGAEAYIPFAFYATTYFGINNASNGPFANGVFHSTDSGSTWHTEVISTGYAFAPVLRRTSNQVYYFAGIYPLWSSRKAKDGADWSSPEAVTKTFSSTYGRFDVAGEGDTAHVCWMDKRNNKWRFNFSGPPIENNEIYYRRRKDSDTDWNKEVLLSKGLLYAYAPTISAEGNDVVVVWAGIGNADKDHTYMAPNDIFYVTSKDGGATWSDPQKVTDSAKDGIVSGMPQVALLNGTIHLLYTQGANQPSPEISPGLRKLGSGPWPIYYTKREFPK